MCVLLCGHTPFLCTRPNQISHTTDDGSGGDEDASGGDEDEEEEEEEEEEGSGGGDGGDDDEVRFNVYVQGLPSTHPSFPVRVVAFSQPTTPLFQYHRTRKMRRARTARPRRSKSRPPRPAALDVEAAPMAWGAVPSF